MNLTRHPARLTTAVIALAMPALAVVPAAAASGRAAVPGQAASPLTASAATAETVATIAGGTGGPGKATSVPLAVGNNDVCGVSFTSGAMYVGDLSTLRRVTFHTGWLTTPVGAGAARFVEAGDGGLATEASGQMCNVTTDHAGNLVFADPSNNWVRVVAVHTGTFYGQPMTAGHIYAVAGNGQQGFAGDGGPATKAEFSGPAGVTLDSAGNLVIADSSNGRIRVVAEHTGTFYGQPMTTGDIYTIAGSGRMGFAGDGGPALDTKMWNLAGIAVDGAGNLLISDAYRIRYVPFRSGTYYGQTMTAKDIYTIAGHSGERGFGFAGDGGPAIKARLFFPGPVAVDGHGNLVIPDSSNNRIRVVAAKAGTFYGRAMKAGDIYTVAGDGTSGYAGDGGLAAAAELNLPESVTVDGSGNLVIADTFNSRIRVLAVRTGTFYRQAMTAGDIYTIAGTGSDGFSGDGGQATAAELSDPLAVAVDGPGALAIADSGTGRIRVVAG